MEPSLWSQRHLSEQMLVQWQMGGRAKSRCHLGVHNVRREIDRLVIPDVNKNDAIQGALAGPK